MADERQHQHVRQRKPDCSQLLVSRSARIDHTSCNIQMRRGIAVIEGVPAPQAKQNETRAQTGRGTEANRDLPKVKSPHLAAATWRFFLHARIEPCMRLEMPGEGGGPDILEMSEGLKLAKA